MLEAHLKALYRRLEAKLGTDVTKTIHVKRVDHFNAQQFKEGMQATDPITPAVYIDFGQVPWKPFVGNHIKQGAAQITVYCVNQTVQETHNKALNPTGHPLKRFSYTEAVSAALEGFAGLSTVTPKLKLFTPLGLSGSQFDTDHGSGYIDVLNFSTTLYYYGAEQSLQWAEMELQGVETEYDKDIPPVAEA